MHPAETELDQSVSQSLGHICLGEGVRGACGREVCREVVGVRWAAEHTRRQNRTLSQAVYPHTVPCPGHSTKASAGTGSAYSGQPLHLQLLPVSALQPDEGSPRHRPHCRKLFMAPLPQWSLQFPIPASSRDTSGTWGCNGCCRPQSSFRSQVS